MFGARDPRTKQTILKPWRILTSQLGMALRLDRRCCHEEPHLPIEGGQRAADSAFYPKPLCRAICQVVAVKKRWDHFRHDLHYGHLTDPATSFAATSRRDRDRGLLDKETKPDDKALETLVRTVHDNLGHPSNESLAKHFRMAGSRPEVIRMAEKLRCSVCEEMSRQKARRPGHVEAVPANGHVVETDGWEWTSEDGTVYKGILAVDRGSRMIHAQCMLHGKPRCGNMTQLQMIEYFSQSWWPWFGRP